ncbi:MAG: hypothetical protein RMJ19_09000, partial [Gemmatales bacterium]|nr:hypothetical protein [Gemmatales bacterium]MDW8175797.1 hypothetical protein [Gemmatales bacterium]
AYLVRLGWGIEALWCLRHYRFVWRLEEVVEAIEIFDDLLERYPRGFFSDLKKQLEARLKELENEKSRLECQHLETEARALLKEPDCPPERIHSLLQRLKVYSDHPRLRFYMQELSEYHQRAVVVNRLRELSDRTQALRKNNNLSAEAKLAGFSALREQLLQSLLEVEFDERIKDRYLLVRKGEADLVICQDQIRHWTRVIAKREAEEQAANLRAYQQWALWQILQFNGRGEVWGKERIWGWHYDVIHPWVDQELRAFGAGKRPDPYEWSLLAEFPNAAKLLKEKLGVDVQGSSLSKQDQQAIYNSAYQRLPGWRGNIDRELAYLTTRDGMVKFLLPIQTQLLEPPVMDLYQRAFQAGWKTLEDHTTFQDDGPDQLYVAKMAAIVKKKTLDEAVEELRKLTNPGK